MRTEQLATALVIQSDAALAAAMQRQLIRAGFVVHRASRGAEALRRATELAPDVVLLDLALPDGDGAEVCRRLRELPVVGDVPILVQSDAADVAATLTLFALGADDVVVKPYDPLEILARVQALVRRRGEQRVTRRVGPLRVALTTGDAWIDATPLDLTTGERSMLVELARAYPGVTTRAALERVPWRASAVGSNVTEVLVARLRRKIAAADGRVEIRAVRRAGYVLRISTPTTVTTT